MNEDASRVVQLALSGYQAQVIAAFSALDLAEHLSGGPLSVSELARVADCHEPSLLRLMRAAMHLELVRYSDDGRLELTSLGRTLCADDPSCVKNFIRLLCGHEVIWQATGRLDHTVRTGEPAYHYLFGVSGYDWLTDRPNAQSICYKAAVESSRFEAPPVAQVCQLPDATSLVDVGGGNGVMMAHLLVAHPALTGTIVDMEVAFERTRAELASVGVDDRCDFVVANFFEDAIPADADVYLLKNVLNDWDDEHVVQILSNCRKSMRTDSRLLIVEPVMPSGPYQLAAASLMVIMSDLCAMVGNGGQLRTEPQWHALLESSGLKLADVESYHIGHEFSIIEASPNCS